jgi:hypothetical protein
MINSGAASRVDRAFPDFAALHPGYDYDDPSRI